MSLEITVTPTRSASQITFTLSKSIVPPGTGLSFPDRQAAAVHPVARAVFAVPGVCSVWILGGDVQVTKDEDARWGVVKPGVIEALQQAAAGL